MKTDFKFERDGYTVYPPKNKVTKTRHGIRAVCKIFRGAKHVATLDDLPERIVAPVEVPDATERAPLLKKAKAAAKAGKFSTLGEANPHDSTLLSEYLRYLTMAADQAWLEASK